MTDDERLAKMVRTVEAIRDNTDGVDRGVFDIWITDSLTIGYGPGASYAQWTITVTPPLDFADVTGKPYHLPARLHVSGQITPLSLRIVTALDGLMWEDRVQ